MFSCFLLSGSSLLCRFRPANPVGSFIIYKHAECPLWSKDSPRPTAWNHSSYMWHSKPSKTLVPKPCYLVWPRILPSCSEPAMPSTHTSTCHSLYRSDLLYYSMSLVSSAWRFFSHFSVEQTDPRSRRAGPQPIPWAPTVACVPLATQRRCHVDIISAFQLPVFGELDAFLFFSPQIGTWKKCSSC